MMLASFNQQCGRNARLLLAHLVMDEGFPFQLGELSVVSFPWNYGNELSRKGECEFCRAHYGGHADENDISEILIQGRDSSMDRRGAGKPSNVGE